MGKDAQGKRRCLFFSEVTNIGQKDGLICMVATVNGKEYYCAFTPELRAHVLAMEERKLPTNVVKLAPRR